MEEAVRTNIYRRTDDKPMTISQHDDDKPMLNQKTDDKPTTILQYADDKPTINQKTDDKPTIKRDAKSLILAYFDTHEECTLKELSEMLGLKTTQTKHYLHDLVETGRIIAKGANKNRTYSLVTEENE